MALFGDGGARKEARRARLEEEQRQARISEGTKKVREQFSGSFDDKYYAGLLDSVNKAYQPEVESQFAEATQQMQAALQRAGLGNSTVGRARADKAKAAKIKADADVVNRGLALQQQRRQDVSMAENTVLGQLNNTADMQSASTNAANQIQNASLYPMTPPLGQVFTDLTAGLATQADMERSGQARYNVFGRLPGWNQSNRYTTNVKG